MAIHYKIVSDSMVPVIKVGDELKIDDNLKLSEISENLALFDIIIFKRDNKLVAHYVWKNQLKFNGTIITRSLKDIFHDENPVYRQEFVGLVTNFKINLFLRLKILLLCLLRGKS